MSTHDTMAGAGPDSGSAPRPSPGDQPAVVLVRHGETEWSSSGRHTGRIDVALTPHGESQARAVTPIVRGMLAGREPFIISSPRHRALDTARLAGFEPDEVTELAAEWDYGELEGRTSAEIRASMPGWSIWQGPVPGGESPDEMTARMDSLLSRIEQLREQDAHRPVLLFTHGHAGRCLAARWLDEPITAGKFLWLNTSAVSSLGVEHDVPVILRWNIDPSVWTVDQTASTR